MTQRLRRLRFTLIAWCCLAAPAWAGPGSRSQATFRDAADLLETLTRTVSPSVVQIRVEAYGLVEASGQATTGLVAGPQERAGSGAIIDVDGYIVTNAHLIAGAQSVRVSLSRGRTGAPAARSQRADYKTLEAQIVGMAPEFDLALLKVAANGLPSLRIAGSETVHQGLMVFSFGLEDGVRSLVTTEVVSTVALQLDTDVPTVYLQTDATNRAGQGGGPLVNIDGELVGVNAFSTAERVGKRAAFSIPGAVLAAVYPRLRADGHLRTAIPGMQVQAITPVLMAGLGLSTTSGVIVSDVSPGGAADRAGVKVQDVVQTVNGQPTDSIPAFALSVATLRPETGITLGVRRGPRQLSLEVPAVKLDPVGAPDLRGYETTWIAQLGIVATDFISSLPALLPPLRIPSGVVVAAREQRSLGREVPLITGDVIHAVDGVSVTSVSGLRGLLNGVATKSPVVLQVERGGRLRFIAVELF